MICWNPEITQLVQLEQLSLGYSDLEYARLQSKRVCSTSKLGQVVWLEIRCEEAKSACFNLWKLVVLKETQGFLLFIPYFTEFPELLDGKNCSVFTSRAWPGCLLGLPI